MYAEQQQQKLTNWLIFKQEGKLQQEHYELKNTNLVFDVR